MRIAAPQLITLSLTFMNAQYAWADISLPPPPTARGDSSMVIGAVFFTVAFVLGGLWLARKIRAKRSSRSSTIEASAETSFGAGIHRAPSTGTSQTQYESDKPIK